MKKALKVATIFIACAVVIAVGHLWVTCPPEEDVEWRIWADSEFWGYSKAFKSESAMTLFMMRAHRLDPMFIYHNYRLCVVVESEGHPVAVFWGRDNFKYFESLPPNWVTAFLGW